MGTSEEGEAFLRQFPGAQEFIPVSDPSRAIYGALGAEMGTAMQLFGPRVWVRGVGALLRGHRVGKVVGDPRQLAAALLVRDGRVVATWAARDQTDIPVYGRLLRKLDP